MTNSAQFITAATSAAASTRSAIASASAATANAYRLYSPIAIDAYYVAAPIVRDAYNAAQGWIANEAPVIEQRIKVTALKIFIAICEFAIDAIDRRDEYKLQYRIAIINAKRSKVRQEIKFWSFVSYNGFDTKAEQFAARSKALWVRKGAIACQVADKVFCLN